MNLTTTSALTEGPIRICLVYDCLFPYTVGGAERWYRALAERLAAAGHEVSYLTLRQWPRGSRAEVPGVAVVAVGPRLRLYTRDGRRRIAPPLVFGLGVFWHLLRNGRRYDVVHMASFPFFSLLAAGALRRPLELRLFVDWFEVWTREYWREYLGPAGAVGAAVQRLCARTRHHAFCFAELHAQRLRDQRFRGELTRLRGLYADGAKARRSAEPIVVFAGRHIPEKRVTVIPHAVAAARVRLPELRCEIYGDGPDRGELLRVIRELRLEQVVDAPGVVGSERVDDALSRAVCLVAPSQREGYGLVVVEAAAHGTPSVVVKGPDNAAAELIENGRNGITVDSPDPEAIAAAIVQVHEAGEALRTATAAWFDENLQVLSIDSSLDLVLRAYEQRE